MAALIHRAECPVCGRKLRTIGRAGAERFPRHHHSGRDQWCRGALRRVVPLPPDLLGALEDSLKKPLKLPADRADT